MTFLGHFTWQVYRKRKDKKKIKRKVFNINIDLQNQSEDHQSVDFSQMERINNYLVVEGNFP
jgi:hypothetical protein